VLRIATNTTRRSGLATVKRILINVEFVRLEWLLVCILPVLLLVLGNDVAYMVGVSVDEDIKGVVFISCLDVISVTMLSTPWSVKIIKLISHIKQVIFASST